MFVQLVVETRSYQTSRLKCKGVRLFIVDCDILAGAEDTFIEDHHFTESVIDSEVGAFQQRNSASKDLNRTLRKPEAGDEDLTRRARAILTFQEKFILGREEFRVCFCSPVQCVVSIFLDQLITNVKVGF